MIIYHDQPKFRDLISRLISAYSIIYTLIHMLFYLSIFL